MLIMALTCMVSVAATKNAVRRVSLSVAPTWWTLSNAQPNIEQCSEQQLQKPAANLHQLLTPQSGPGLAQWREGRLQLFGTVEDVQSTVGYVALETVPHVYEVIATRRRCQFARSCTNGSDNPITIPPHNAAW